MISSLGFHQAEITSIKISVSISGQNEDVLCKQSERCCHSIIVLHSLTNPVAFTA
jgi:hypothetical protein